MTGTSLDGLDAALVSIDGKGLDLEVKVMKCVSRPLGELSIPLRNLASQRPTTARQIMQLSADLAKLHIDAIKELTGGKQKLDLIALHGQTIIHDPPLSWQISTPAPIVRAFQAPVVYDFRAADIAAGGQGAPITPIADHVLFRHIDRMWAVVNLGGFANATMAPRLQGRGKKAVPHANLREYFGFDICICNNLLDYVSREMLGKPYDENGDAASKGRVIDDALWDLQGILSAQSRAHRSLGTRDEMGDWLDRYRKRVSGPDMCATACEAVAHTVAHALAERVQDLERIILAGGGLRNKALEKHIRTACPIDVETSDQHGIPGSHREAVCMAVLGHLCLDRVPITLPQVTGVPDPAPMSGAWMYP